MKQVIVHMEQDASFYITSKKINIKINFRSDSLNFNSLLSYKLLLSFIDENQEDFKLFQSKPRLKCLNNLTEYYKKDHETPLKLS